MKKGVLLGLTLLFGFGIGYYAKYRSVANEGWKTFDSSKWKSEEQVTIGENYRKKMVFDLVHNKLKFRENGTRLSKVIELIGESSNFIEEKHGAFILIEKIEEKYGWNIDPEGGIDLKLYFDKDSVLEYWKIEEFWHEP